MHHSTAHDSFCQLGDQQDSVGGTFTNLSSLEFVYLASSIHILNNPKPTGQ